MEKNNIWNHAANAGLVLGLVSTAYMSLTQFIASSQMNAFVSMFINFVLWAVKFGGCIYLMSFFMKKLVDKMPDADNSTTLKFGVLTALLSGFVYASATFINMTYISTDFVAEQYAIIMDMYKNIMDSNTLSTMDKMMDKMPQISFFSNLLYCFFYGTVLSSILSRVIPNKNPFADIKSEEK